MPPLKYLGLYKCPNGATAAMFVYGCCMTHAAAEWKEFMTRKFPEMNVMYLRPVRLHEHRLNLPEFYAVHRECFERSRNND